MTVFLGIVVLATFIGLGIVAFKLSEDKARLVTENHNLSDNVNDLKFRKQILSNSVDAIGSELEKTREALEQETLRNYEVLSQKKSSEVKVGAIAENLVPLLQGLPYDATNLKHLGQPIDFIYFDYSGAEGPEIIFVEVKSGKAKESKRQKLIKNAVRLGKVHYEELRIDEKGIKIKRATNEE